MFGNILGYKVKNQKVIIDYDKIQCTVTIVNDSVVNFFAPTYRNSRDSKAVEDLKVENIDFKVKCLEEENKKCIVIETLNLIVKIYDEFKVDIFDINGEVLCKDYRGQREPFNRRGNTSIAEAEGHKLNGHEDYKLCISKVMEEEMYFYGFGERPGPLNKKNCHYRNWNTDDPTPHGETYQQLYKSIPFFIMLKDYKDKSTACGIFFDNHFETHYDLGKENPNYYFFSAVEGNLDYYFIYGPKVKDVLNEYTSLTGRTPLPQMWTLGYQQCRWSYVPEERVMEVAKNFRDKDIPCDTIYLDIDYMDGFRVFTWDNEKFKDPKAFTDKLKDMGFKVVTIIDPGVKVDKGYRVYDEGLENRYFATDKDGIVYSNWVWPGNTVFPDFMNSKTRNWWAENQKVMIDSGVSGIWNDMNEPASFNGPLPEDVMFDYDGMPVTHKEIHNVYGHMMDKATYEGIKKYTNKRPFVVTRACYAGTQKYATVWTGDNQSTWEHLRMSLPMLMNLGLSGMSYCGTDVGGFGHDCTGELLSRWVQVGAFTPLFRNHSTIGSRDQEPWAFDKQTEDINRKYIKLRYKLLPYMYDLYWKCENSGAPIIRPLLFNYQEDKNTYEISDEFMFGDNILVAPVVEQGARNRMVYLPKGDKWIDYWTSEEFEGGQYIIKKAPLDICPIFIKKFSVIPTKAVQNYVGEINDDTLTLDIYLGKNYEGSDSKGSKFEGGNLEDSNFKDSNLEDSNLEDSNLEDSNLEDSNFEITYTHYNDDGESFDYRNGIFNKYDIKIFSNFNNSNNSDINFSNDNNGIIFNIDDDDIEVGNIRIAIDKEINYGSGYKNVKIILH